MQKIYMIKQMYYTTVIQEQKANIRKEITLTTEEPKAF
jgi:hypothetical protein